MGKAKIKVDHEKESQKKNLWISMFILVIMVLSVAGFALMSGGGSVGSGDTNEVTVPLQEGLFRDQVGNTYWGAYVKGEQFVFVNGIEGYEERL